MARKLMHAVQYDCYGGGAASLKHAEVPIPTPKKGELLLKLEAASLNAFDWKIQKGVARPFLPSKFPYVPVTDVAGEIVEVGQGVKNFKAGDKVVAVLSHSNGGGLAEYAVAKASLTVTRPPEVSAAEGAGLPVAGLTAHQALTQVAGVKLDGTGKQMNILITAASGGVGQYAVQLAKLGNTHVTATCGARNIEFVKSLGADEVLDYKTPDGAALKSPSGRKYDAVVHCALAGIPWSTFEPNLSGTGKVIDLSPNSSSFTTFALKKLTFSKKQLLPMWANLKRENLDYLVNLVKAGKLKTMIDSKHPLSEAEDAWAKARRELARAPVCTPCRRLHILPQKVIEIGVDMIDKLMHAVQYSSYGGGPSGLEHVEVPIPTPNKDDVLLKVEAASLNPFDWKVQKGMLRPLLPRKFPHIPANDVAGEVVKVGMAVKNFKPGDKVVAMINPATGGGLAEFAVTKESLTVARPPEVSAAHGAGLPVAGLTAHQALTQSAGIKLNGSGMGKQANILVTAASGGVGHYAVQLAKLGNTHVTATCGARNIKTVKSLGADEVLDYKTPDGAALKSPSGRKYDAVIHCASGIPWSTFEPNLCENGKVIDITPGPSSLISYALKTLTFAKKKMVPLVLIPKGENLNYLVKLVREGKLKTVIDSKYSLSKAEAAWAKSINGHATGKIIVEP
ncbi:hypothetical protein FNV43_RR23019 [Rhamnella rubrinervis]|uniref:Enoyl reductase (ER) domain-containing protein n=1 Tax=Rhamnella rubrinervis TaxID=2594499 RepID=A0A8K0GNR2_9ROSA|nr:hypothetical protein FNV43_RR23019 [Rhamnella rubrinervis]